MIRSLAFACCAAVCCAAIFAFSTAFAQDEAEVIAIKATPEILSLFDESLQSLSQAEPAPQARGLFRLLGLAINFDDKAHAQKIIDALVALAPTIEPEELRNQLFAGVANAFCDLEKYPEAIAVLNRIGDSDMRSGAQLNIAAGIILEQEQNKTSKPFDTSGLLRQAIAGAVASKNVALEVVSRAFLGSELVRQGKQGESTTAFAEAMKTAQKVEDVEERGQVIGIIFQRQVEHDQIAGATAMLQTIDPEAKPLAVAAFASALIQREKYAEAEALVKTLSSGDVRDNLLGSFIMANIKTVTDAKVGELASLVSSDEIRERFLQVITSQLQRNGRNDVAVLVGKRLKEPTVAEMSLFVGKIEALVEEKKFAEAIQFVDEAEDNEGIRHDLKRRILMMHYQETNDEATAAQIETTFASREKIAIGELREEAKKAISGVSDLSDRIEILLAVFEEQSRFLDFAGAKQTMKFIAEQLDKTTEPSKVIQDRLLLARLQVELRDKDGAKANLGKLAQTLSAVKNLSELKDLVPTLPSEPGVEPTIDESAIQNQLFQVFCSLADMFSKVDAKTESQAAFAKARELAKVEPVAATKAEKLLMLAQFLAEEQGREGK